MLAIKSPVGLPVMIEAVGRAVSTQTLAAKGNMDNIMERLMAMQRMMNHSGDRNEHFISCINLKRLLDPRSNNLNLICFRPPQPAMALAKAATGTTTPPDELCDEMLSLCIPYPTPLTPADC